MCEKIILITYYFGDLHMYIGGAHILGHVQKNIVCSGSLCFRY